MYKLKISQLAVSLCFIGFGASAQAEQVTIGALPQGSVGYSIAASASNVITKNSEISATAVPTGGSSITLPQVNNGEMEFATSNTVEAVFATQGTGNFDGRPLKNLRVAAVLVPFATGIVVQQDSDIRVAADLKGQPFPSGYSAQKLVGIMQEATLAADGLTVEEFEQVNVPNFARAVELLAADRLSGAYSAPGSGVIRQAEADVGVRFISIENATPEGEKAMQKIAPGSYFIEVQPTPSNAGVKKPVTLLGYEYTLMVGEHVSDETVYSTVKALYENQESLVDGHPIFRAWDPKRIYLPLDVPYHPGAERFFRETGLM